MHRPSRDPQRTTHRPSGCEWLDSFASGRDGCPWPSSQRQLSPFYFLGHTAVSVWDTTSRACVCAYIATEACRLLRPALSRFVRTYSLTRVLPVWSAPAHPLQPQRPPYGSWLVTVPGSGTILWAGAYRMDAIVLGAHGLFRSLQSDWRPRTSPSEPRTPPLPLF